MITVKLKEKDIASKDAAAEYAFGRVPERFRKILKVARTCASG